MRFIVDGYNVTKEDPATSSLDLERQRDSLVSRLATRGGDLLGRGEITVVFDGVSGAGADYRQGPVNVRFSRVGTADDLIAQLAGFDATVVTSDQGLAARARARGACVRGREAVFEESGGAKRQRRSRRRPFPDDDLPPGAHRVTEELKTLWLKGEE